MPQILILARGRIANGNAYRTLIGDKIIKVILAVVALDNVGRVHLVENKPLFFGVVHLFPDNALVPPVFKVVYGRGIANVIVHAKELSVELIVRAVNIHSVAENVRLPVGDIFVRRKIRIKYLFHKGSFPFLFFYFRLCLYYTLQPRPYSRRIFRWRYNFLSNLKKFFKRY